MGKLNSNFGTVRISLPLFSPPARFSQQEIELKNWWCGSWLGVIVIGADLHGIVNIQCENQFAIDKALKTYLALVASSADAYLRSDSEWAKCVFNLLDSSLFRKHKSYVRRRMCGRLRKEQSTPRLHLVAKILLYDGRETQKVFELMQGEQLFGRLVELVRARKDSDPVMWRVCLELLYEMSRIQRLKLEDLGT
jgi:hypothetical protein